MTNEDDIKSHVEHVKAITDASREIRKKRGEKAKNTGLVIKTIQAALFILVISTFMYIVSYIVGYGMAGGAILAGICL